MSWQPISTAPEGEWIRVRGEGWETTAKLNGRDYEFKTLDIHGPATVSRDHMTHWMPLPAPPEDTPNADR